MGDIYLDPVTGDIDLSTKQPILIKNIADAVRQRLRIRLNTFEGEWFYDSEVGVPYFQDILGRRSSQTIIDGIFRRVVLDTENVIDILDYSSSFNPQTRKYNLTFTVTTSSGDLVSVSN